MLKKSQHNYKLQNNPKEAEIVTEIIAGYSNEVMCIPTDVILFLASDKARYIDGDVIRIDGGQNLE